MVETDSADAANANAVARISTNTLRPVPARLYVRINIDPRTASAIDDRFKLFSNDGSYNQTKTIRDDLVAGDEWIDLLFTGLQRGARYSLEVATGDEPPYLVFENLPYGEVDSVSPYTEDESPQVQEEPFQEQPVGDEYDIDQEGEDVLLFSSEDVA